MRPGTARRRRASRGARASRPREDGPTGVVRDRWRLRFGKRRRPRVRSGAGGCGSRGGLNDERSCGTKRDVPVYLSARVPVDVPSRDLLVVAARVQLVLGVPSHRGDELRVDVSAALHLEAHRASRPPRPRDGSRFTTLVARRFLFARTTHVGSLRDAADDTAPPRSAVSTALTELRKAVFSRRNSKDHTHLRVRASIASS